jgi:hypothetical protein
MACTVCMSHGRDERLCVARGPRRSLMALARQAPGEAYQALAAMAVQASVAARAWTVVASPALAAARASAATASLVFVARRAWARAASPALAVPQASAGAASLSLVRRWAWPAVASLVLVVPQA